MSDNVLLVALIISLIITLFLLARDAYASFQIKELYEENAVLKDKIWIKENRIDSLEMELERGHEHLKITFWRFLKELPDDWVKHEDDDE